MENRGQKRAEVLDEFPADKRACNSLDFRPSSSNSSVQTQAKSINSTLHSNEADMETSSTASASSRSDGEGDRDSYASCDSDDVDPRYSGLRDYQRSRSFGDQTKFKSILSSLTEETGPDGQLSALTELCEVLSFCTEDSLSSVLSDALAPILVKLAKHDSSPDIMLLAVRAITYLCDVFPRSSGFLVRHDAVPALCERLTAIEYLDVAEQCLQALEKISRDQPLACLHAGAIMAVLNFIDFFSTSIQRVALSTVVNICRKLPSECPSQFMDAIPVLCNLIQYEDRQLVESVAHCLIKIVDRVWQSPDMLDEVCTRGLINQSIQRINVNSHTTLSQPIYSGLFGVLIKLTAGSTYAFKTLHELRVSHILKGVLSTSELYRGVSSTHQASGHCIQVQDVLKLIRELLPSSANSADTQQVSDREAFLANNPELLRRLGNDILPSLIQMVNSGTSLSVCYYSLSIINNLLSLSTYDVLVEVFNNCDIPSFLAGVFSHTDQHVLMMALQISKTSLEKFSDVCLNSFMKEGVFFAIDSLLHPEENSKKLFSVYGSNQLLLDLSQRSTARGTPRCLCYAFDTVQSPTSTSEPACCLEKDAVLNLAKQIKMNYFSQELCNSHGVLTDILQKLQTLSTALADLMDASISESTEEKYGSILSKIMEMLSGKEPISTFELIESGILKVLVNYLSDGLYLWRKDKLNRCDLHNLEKRSKMLVKLLLPLSDGHSEDFPLLLLIRRLHSALSSLENFPIVLTHGSKLRSSYVTVPYDRGILHPCLKVRFLKDEEEALLSDYSQDAFTVDPFSSLDAIERFLSPRVRIAAQSTNTSSSTKQNLESSADVKGSHFTSIGEDIDMLQSPASSGDKDASLKLVFYLGGEQLEGTITLYQAILQQQIKLEKDMIAGTNFWSQVYTLTYGRAAGKTCPPDGDKNIQQLSILFSCKIASNMEHPSSVYDILILLKSMNLLNRLSFEMASRDKMSSNAEVRVDDLNYLKATITSLPQHEFVSNKLTEKLEQQLRDPLIVTVGALPLWCTQLLSSCPFLFSFEVRFKYYRLAAFGVQAYPTSQSGTVASVSDDRRRNLGGSRKKFLVHRDHILDSAAEMMAPSWKGGLIEVEFDNEVGTGLGPTLEFFTLVSHEFQKVGLGMWRGDYRPFSSGNRSSQMSNTEMVPSALGFFPRPLSPAVFESGDPESSEIIKNFLLLGKVVAKALQDRRVLDFHFSTAFYKMLLGQDLSLFDILSFDPKLGRTLLEFQALVDRRSMVSDHEGEKIQNCVCCFRNMSIEDLCLDFTLPGYPDYVLSSRPDHKLVNVTNLEDYVALVVDATIRSGVFRQVEAFKSGFNQVFSIEHLQVFSEVELECLLCGEHESWTFNELLDYVKFDHGYTASSPPIINLLEIIQEFDQEQRRAFLQFVTGAPRLPPGGLALLNPKLTIVRKHCCKLADTELPSVMTCANYLKLPPYSTKDKMREKILYAIKEGQGSFHLS